YQEVLSGIALGSRILTGLFLNMTLRGPGGSPESYERTLVDRIGYAARQGFVEQTVTADPSEQPIVGPSDLYTIKIQPGDQSHGPTGPITVALQKRLSALEDAESTGSNPANGLLLRSVLTLFEENRLDRFLVASAQHTAADASFAGVKAYYARP